jgi:hypothetical protein
LSFGPLPEEEALAVLADASGAGSEYRKQLTLLVEFLTATGVVQRDAGMIRLARQQAGTVADSAASQPESRSPEPTPEPVVRTGPPRFATGFTQSPEGGIVFNVSFKVDMAEMGNWKPERIAAFFSGIAQVLSAKAAAEKESATNYGER